jgi:hypothetical protein
MKEFQECKSCDKKPGSPTLCESCLNNRSLIHQLAIEIERLQRKLSVIDEILDL